MSIEYTLTGQLRCRCPLQYPPRIPGIRFRFPKPFMSHEAGFFYQLLPPVTPLVELMTAHSPESTMDGRIFEPLPVGNQLGPLRWAVNHSPRGGPTYPKSPSDLISAQERVGICQ